MFLDGFFVCHLKVEKYFELSHHGNILVRDEAKTEEVCRGITLSPSACCLFLLSSEC